MSGYEGASPAAVIHRLLLRLAGRFPDDVLAADRIALAANDYEVPKLGHIARQRVLAELFRSV